MAEHLVILKTQRQRGIEGWLTLALPPLAALAMRFEAGGPSLLGVPVVFFIFFASPAIGSTLAARLGWVEWVTPDERRKRLADHLLGMAPAKAVGWMSLSFTVWLASVFAVIIDFHEREELLLLSGIALAGGLVAGALCLMSIRRQQRVYAAAEAEQWPEQTLRGRLPGYLKIHYPCLLGGAALGMGAGWFLPYPASMLALLAGLWGGLVLESVLLSRLRVPKRPLLWTQISFGGALGLSLLQMGIPFAILLGLIPLMNHHVDPLFMVVFGIGGGLFGMAIGLVQWTVARLGNIGQRRRGT